MSKKLTQRQKAVLDFIIKYVAEHGYPPSIREMRAEFGIASLRGVTVHLDALERKGYIRRESTSRSIQILKTEADSSRDDLVPLPLLGAIAAGAPLLASENIEAEISVPRAMLGAVRDAFLLRVKGDSMVEAHIMDGDLVVIRPQRSAGNGDLVAALIDGEEATIKRLRTDYDSVVLAPANPAYQPIPLEGADVRLIGKVIGLLRAY